MENLNKRHLSLSRAALRLPALVLAVLMTVGVFAILPLHIAADTKTAVELDRPALELVVGETDKLSVKGLAAGAKVTWSSSDESVVTVTADGTVNACGVGQAEITAEVNGKTAVCTVYAVEERYNVFTDNITVSTFWPPEGPDYIYEEQYKWMAEAGITYVMGAGSNVGEKQDQLNMLSWCYKYGMRMMVGDDRMGPAMASMSDDELAALIGEYKNVPGVAGWWLIDEPGDPFVFADVYCKLKELAPEQEVYLNFLPGSGDAYCNQVDSFLRVLRAKGCTADYYQYDSYNVYLDRTDYVRQLDALSNSLEICKANGVKQAAFILSTGHGGYSQPNENEIRWQMNSSLAFGVKLIQYFTWFCPSSFAEEGRKLGIINADGEKTPLYEGVSRVNHETLTIGKTLIGLEVADVRVNGSHYENRPLTEDFPLSCESKAQFIASFMRDPETGRYYLMLVNNDSSRKQEISVTLDSRIGKVTLIDNGTNQSFTRDGQVLTVSSNPGEAFLFELPAGLDLFPDTPAAKDGENLAAHAYAYADKVSSGSDSAIAKVTDGIRFRTNEISGWLCDESEADLTLDFGRAYSFNRADLYPAGFGERYGDNMPTDFDIQVSDNGTDWKTVKTVTGYSQDSWQAPRFTFDTVSARYIRLHMTNAGGTGLGLCEVEVYLDNGSLPATEEYKPPVQQLGENIAPDAYLTATASTEAYGWSLSCLTDGYRAFSYENSSQGYSNDGVVPCSVVLDFGLRRKFDTIKLYPAMNQYVNHENMLYFPADFSFEVSNDGETWTTVFEITDFVFKKKSKPYEITFDTVEARFLRWTMTKQDYSSVCVSELQVFWNVDDGSLTESETEPVTEPVTEPDTEAATETVTELETVKETVTEATTEAARAETETAPDGSGTEPAAGGCASVLTAVSLILSLAAAAVCLTKKKH